MEQNNIHFEKYIEGGVSYIIQREFIAHNGNIKNPSIFLIIQYIGGVDIIECLNGVVLSYRPKDTIGGIKIENSKLVIANVDDSHEDFVNNNTGFVIKADDFKLIETFKNISVNNLESILSNGDVSKNI